jgi:hypothetical protein
VQAGPDLGAGEAAGAGPAGPDDAHSPRTLDVIIVASDPKA